MASEENFCRNYFVLKPENASILNLLRLLYSSDLDKFGEFVESSESDVLRDFWSRWIIFISILVQKILVYLRWPMASIGYVIEMWLNLLSSNGGFWKLLLHLLKGTVVIPDKASATFKSAVGNIDTRVELDKGIRNKDSNYGASLSMMAAKLSYENQAYVQTVIQDHWQMELLGFFNFWNDYQEKFSTQAIMFNDTTSNPNLIVVAFRGTDPFDADDWRTDVDFSWHELRGVGKIHSGFMKALGLQKRAGWPKQIELSLGRPQFAYYTLREKIRDVLQKNATSKLILTGHSLGGALAILLAAVLALHQESWLLERLDGVYTFGQPRVGDGQFGEFMKEKMRVYDVKYWRYVYSNDMVPRLPYDDGNFLYNHFGHCLYFNSCYKGKAMEEEPNKNYFSLLWAIPKNLNAVWELIRSFIIPYSKGQDYKEGWLMRLARVIGIAIPGLVAHFPQDYVNLTRLGHLHLQNLAVHKLD